MAFTQAQRFGVHRLPIPDGVVDDLGDRFAVTGVLFPTLLTELNVNQRFGVHRLVFPDGIFRYNDRLVIAGALPSEEETSRVTDIFDVSWVIDPTWVVTALPGDNDGVLTAGIDTISASFAGAFSDTLAAPVDPGEAAFQNYLDMQVREIVIGFVTRDNLIAGSVRSNTIVAATRRIEITLQEQLTFIEQEPSGGAPIT